MSTQPNLSRLIVVPLDRRMQVAGAVSLRDAGAGRQAKLKGVTAKSVVAPQRRAYGVSAFCMACTSRSVRAARPDATGVLCFVTRPFNCLPACCVPDLRWGNVRSGTFMICGLS